MINTLVAIGYFILSILYEDLNLQWHKARERRRPFRGANISLAMGIIAILPFVLLVTSNNWQIIVADLVGGYVGNYFGIKRHVKEEPE